MRVRIEKHVGLLKTKFYGVNYSRKPSEKVLLPYSHHGGVNGAYIDCGSRPLLIWLCRLIWYSSFGRDISDQLGTLMLEREEKVYPG
jgi:hypothetical protein